jgi:hypothetical protein
MMFMMMNVHIRALMVMQVDAYEAEVDDDGHDVAFLMPMLHFFMFWCFL